MNYNHNYLFFRILILKVKHEQASSVNDYRFKADANMLGGVAPEHVFCAPNMGNIDGD